MGAQRRAEDEFQPIFAQVMAFIEQQILRACLDPYRLLCTPRQSQVIQTQPIRQMNDVKRRIACQACQIDHSCNGLGLALQWSAACMVDGRTMARSQQLRAPGGYGSIIFRMYRRQCADLAQACQDLQCISVVELVPVGQVKLEAGNAFVVDHGAHFVEDGLVDMLDHTVKAVVNHGLTEGGTVVDLQLVVQAASGRTKAHVVNDGCRTATGSGTRAAEKIIAAAGDADIDVEMCVHINAARQHITASRVDHCSTFGCQILPDGTDAPVLNQQISVKRSLGTDHRTVLDESFHLLQAQG